MRQKLFTLVAVVSAVLCAGLLVLWARGYWTTDVVVLSGREMHRLSSGGAGVFVESLGLSTRRGDWRVSKGQVSPSGMLSEYAETREDYAHWRLATFGSRAGVGTEGRSLPEPGQAPGAAGVAERESISAAGGAG